LKLLQDFAPKRVLGIFNPKKVINDRTEKYPTNQCDHLQLRRYSSEFITIHHNLMNSSFDDEN
jgi:hypothetical protein